MATKSTNNPVFSYLKNLGIRKQDNLRVLLSNKYGTEAANKLRSAFDAIEMKRETGNPDLTERYDFIHSDPDFSRIMSCFADGAYLTDICRYVNSNRARFGKTILDAGCGSGILTCFLATLLPDSTILAVDRSGNAISMAKQLREELALTNVVFMNNDVSAVSGRTFDTVLALRTISENMTFTEDYMLSFGENLEKCALAIRPYMETLGKLVSPGGNLILGESVSRQLPALAIQNELNHLQMGAAVSDISELSCRIGDDRELTHYMLCIGTKGQIIDNQDMLIHWEKSSLTKDRNGSYTDTAARYMLWQLSDSLLDGYKIHRLETGMMIGQLSVSSMKGRDDLLLLYQAEAANAVLGIFPMSRKEEAIAFLEEGKQRYADQGLLVLRA